MTYEGKHNEANGEDNRDGTDENFSDNWGVEGPTDDPAIVALRRRVIRSMLTVFFFSSGTPMLLAGDEFGRSQNGNNNAYCQDNETSWLNWRNAETEAGKSLMEFTLRLIQLRKLSPLVTAPKFVHGREEPQPGLRDIDWLDERGAQLSAEDWSNRQGRALVLRRAAKREDGRIEVLALMMNASDRPLHFQLPGRYPWHILIDSADPALAARELKESTYIVQDRAAVAIAALVDAPQ